MKFAACMAFSFIIFFHILLVPFFIDVYIYMFVCFVCFCLIVKIIYFCCYVYVLLFLLCSVLCILFHYVVLCTVCVSMCSVLLPPGVNPIAVNKIFQYLRHLLSSALYVFRPKVSHLSSVLSVLYAQPILCSLV